MGGRFGFAGMLAGAALGVAFGGGHHYGQTRYPAGHKPRRGYYFKPHNGEREIARRLRQAERNAERQRERYLAQFPSHRRDAAPENVGQSRRGGLVFL